MASSVTMYIIGYMILARNKNVQNEPPFHHILKAAMLALIGGHQVKG